mmetsp:Transcript_185/g.694  ORF Transcript_185/g.694 Transcript_185/m.694 type:complete len:80 (+) Transcript_185:779-1018(+)
MRGTVVSDFDVSRFLCRLQKPTRKASSLHSKDLSSWIGAVISPALCAPSLVPQCFDFVPADILARRSSDPRSCTGQGSS